MTENKKSVSDKKIKTRIAPSPTGPLHIGTARTALFSWAYARQHGGEFILRIEDTDLERSDQRFEDDIIKSLAWLGLKWDNEEIIRQTDRLDIYEKYINELLAAGKAFWCAHTPEELANERDGQMQRREAPRHICSFRDSGGAPGVGIIRLKNDAAGKVAWHDMIRGDVAFDAELLGDFSLAKAPRVPLYNFAVVVDDYDMEITHVIRGEDHIPNTPKQMLIQRALGVASPVYGHLPLILGRDRSKLSKREGATSINEYRQDGFLPEAIFNFIMLLGWHPEGNNEMIDAENFLKEFSIERVQKGGAVFDLDKLSWINKEYLKKIDTETLARLALEFVPAEWRKRGEEDASFWRAVVNLERERLTKLSELPVHIEYFFKEPFYQRELLPWKGKQDFADVARHLKWLMAALSDLTTSEWNNAGLTALVMPYAEEHGRGDVLWPWRVSLCGQKNSPGPFEIAAILGKDAVLARIQKALEYLAL